MNFACKNFNVEEVVRCGFSLTKAEFKILEHLMKNNAEKISAKSISQSLKLELSTVQRCLKKMTEKNIVKRTQINLGDGGYIFYYCVCDTKEIKTQIKDIIKKWFDKTNEEIDRW